MNDHRDKVDPYGPNRRDFLQTAGLVGAGLTVSGPRSGPRRRPDSG